MDDAKHRLKIKIHSNFKIDHNDLHYLTGSETILQMLRNKITLCFSEHMMYPDKKKILEEIEEWMNTHGSGVYCLYFEKNEKTGTVEHKIMFEKTEDIVHFKLRFEGETNA